jgi:hypothetical protein
VVQLQLAKQHEQLQLQQQAVQLEELAQSIASAVELEGSRLEVADSDSGNSVCAA